MREFFIANAAYWIDEFHFDGLRLDATQSIHDGSQEHVIAAMTRAARAAAGGRSIVVIGENEPQHAKLLRPPEEGGYGLDGLWNDDFHHSATVAATGRDEAYYEDHQGTPQELIAAAKHGFLFQGQFYAHQGKRRGTPGLDLPAAALVAFLQNHDQIANSARGSRLHQLTSPGRVRALTALAPADAFDADAVSGPGVPGVDAVPLFRRSQAGAGAARSRRPARLRAPVSKRRGAGDAGAACRSGGPRQLRALQARLERSRAPRRRGRAPPRPPALAARGSDLRPASVRVGSTGRCSARRLSRCATSARAATTG